MPATTGSDPRSERQSRRVPWLTVGRHHLPDGASLHDPVRYRRHIVRLPLECAASATAHYPRRYRQTPTMCRPDPVSVHRARLPRTTYRLITLRASARLPAFLPGLCLSTPLGLGPALHILTPLVSPRPCTPVLMTYLATWNDARVYP